MKKPPLLLIFLVSLAVCACDNPLMAKILQPKIITFDSNGGSPVQPQTVFKNEKIPEPNAPNKAGYYFSGWFTYNDNFYKGWDFNDIPEGDMVLYACWTEGILDAWNFYIKGVGTVIYDGNPKEVTVTPMEGTTTGNITVYYKGVNGTEYAKTPDAPIDLGIYKVTFDVELVDGWHLANELEAGTLTIIEKIDSVKSSSDLRSLLEALATNTPNTPYTIPLEVSSLNGIKDTLDNAGKYVALDLSGSTITEIPNNAFCSSENVISPCYFLTGIIIPKSVKSIGDDAFRGCENLTSVTIGSGVNSIGDEAFRGCIRLTEVIFSGQVNANSFSQSAFGKEDGYIGDLREKYLGSGTTTGGSGPGTYTRPNDSKEWTKQP